MARIRTRAGEVTSRKRISSPGMASARITDFRERGFHRDVWEFRQARRDADRNQLAVGQQPRQLQFMFIDASCPMDLPSLTTEWFAPFRGCTWPPDILGTSTTTRLTVSRGETSSPHTWSEKTWSFSDGTLR